MQRRELNKCTVSLPDGLTERQRKVYSYLCLAYSLESQCDAQRSGNGRLDEYALRRRARYLSMNCSFSPRTLFGDLNLNTTTRESSQGLSTGDTPKLQYEAAIRKAASFLQNYVDANGKFFLSNLTKSSASSRDPATSRAIFLLHTFHCAESASGEAIAVTPEFFVRCMADRAVYGCAREQAEQEARGFPDTCVL